LGILDQRWAGVKILGIGGNGIAGLWEKKIATTNSTGQVVNEKVLFKQIGNESGARVEAHYERFQR
tara:strand:+ start:762 stop:959 length:198 start_codon:yes stop_codon:yes gene_type:complete